LPKTPCIIGSGHGERGTDEDGHDHSGEAHLPQRLLTEFVARSRQPVEADLVQQRADDLERRDEELTDRGGEHAGGDEGDDEELRNRVPARAVR
jgi:hypothetical protein